MLASWRLASNDRRSGSVHVDDAFAHVASLLENLSAPARQTLSEGFTPISRA
jgi:hypothetical protein